MRQTGRTTRIVQHVFEQLQNVGTCVATDHICYEHKPTFEMILFFEEKVKREVEFRMSDRYYVKTKIIRIEEIPYIKFELVLK